MKTIAKILAVSALGVLAACSSQPANQNNDTAQSQPQAKEQAKTADTKTAEFPDIDINELNRYFSEIASAHLNSFEAGKLHDTTMIEFSIYYLWINSFNSFRMDNAYGYLSDKEVDKTCMKYFGQKPSKHQPVSEGYIKYQNGEYILPAGDGEGITFAMVDKLIAKKGATAEYAVTLYSGPDDELDVLLDKSKWATWDEADRPEAFNNVKATLIYKDGKYYLNGWQYQE